MYLYTPNPYIKVEIYAVSYKYCDMIKRQVCSIAIIYKQTSFMVKVMICI